MYAESPPSLEEFKKRVQSGRSSSLSDGVRNVPWNETLLTFVEDGDITRLMDYLESSPLERVLRAGPYIQRALSVKARDDLDDLADELFARILQMAGYFLLRTQLRMMTSIRNAEQDGATLLSNLPHDLTDNGLLERAERISRFIAEMATIRSRIRHVNSLTKKNEKAKDERPDADPE